MNNGPRREVKMEVSTETGAVLMSLTITDVITTSASQRTEYTLRYPTRKGSERRRPR